MPQFEFSENTSKNVAAYIFETQLGWFYRNVTYRLKIFYDFVDDLLAS